MKKKKWLIPIIIVLIVLLVGGVFTYKILSDENKLTSEERTWINGNINNVQNIYVVKDENIFSKDGHGVFYDFLNDFSKEYGININVITFLPDTEANYINLNYTKDITENNNVFYKDHYVLLSKENKIFNVNSDLEGIKVNVLQSDLEFIKSYLKEVNITYNTFDNKDELFKSLEDNDSYIIVPRMKYLTEILSNNLEIVYHFSDINISYTLNGVDDILSSILSKYFVKWEENINAKIKEEEFKIFTDTLNISDASVDDLLSINYNYGFINNSPYEVIMSGNYGGIISEYLQEFSKFSGVYFDITKYKNNNKLASAINKGKVDLYFDFNDNISSDYKSTENGINSSISILTNKDNNKVFNSIYGLQGEEVYVEANSNLYRYLESIPDIKINTYNSSKELFKLNNKDVIIVMDTYIFNYYQNSKLNHYISKYNSFINSKYTFKINEKYSTLYLLLNKYINYLDSNKTINDGINSHLETIMSGNILNNIAKYFIISIVAILVIGVVVYKNSKKIRIARRLKKDEKIRFIDELTCLKNRAYLSDFMKSWSNNTIYPQTIIVVDLNRLKEINNQYGVGEGDKQIQAAANALIKTQLDNSDLIRSDGNEFIIYTIGYNQKQIINYIHKLNKELKKLPYNYGAEFGYSIIDSNLKTIEDAINEATNDMLEKKASENNEG